MCKISRLISIFLVFGIIILANNYHNDVWAKSENIFTFPLILSPETLDPANVSDMYAATVIQQMFDGLVQYDEHLNIIPSIAGSWKISMDGKEYTFKLRKGVKFHNGREVVAGDVVFSFKRILDPSNHSPYAPLFQMVLGAKAFQNGLTDKVKGMRVLDKHTVKITLSQPYAPFIYVLGVYGAKILPKEEVEKLGELFSKRPIGTGPFRFVKWEPDKEIVLESNTDYFEGSPQLDKVVFKLYPSTRSEDVYRDFLAKEVDCFEIPPQWKEKLPEEGKYWRVKRPILGIYFYALNNNNSMLQNGNVRLAMNYAIDKARFIGRFIPANKIMPPGMLGYDPSNVTYSYNFEKARRLMEGVEPTSIEILSVVKSEMAVRELNVVKENLSAIGIKTEISYAESWDSFMKRVRTKNVDIYRYAWLADFPDPDNFLGILFHSTSQFNMFNYKNGEVDKLLEAGKDETDMLRRAEIYRKAEKIILEDAPIVPIGFYAQELLVQPYVKALELGPLGTPYIPMKKILIEDH